MIKRIYLEITNACDLRCPFCTNRKGNRYLSIEEIRFYLPQIREITDYIYLHILGEPLLHPDLPEIFSLLNQYGMKLQLVTNGTLLYRYPDLLKEPCLRKLSISLHACNDIPIPEGYLETIDSLLEQEREAVIELRFYDEAHLKAPLLSYLDTLKKRYHFTETNKKGSFRIKDKTYLYIQDLFRWPDIRDPEISLRGKCHADEMTAINSNSNVTLCCLDPEAYNRIGSLKEKSLREILDSDDYKRKLESLRGNGDLSELCRKCSYRLRFR